VASNCLKFIEQRKMELNDVFAAIPSIRASQLNTGCYEGVAT
jgi:hypothetical protein